MIILCWRQALKLGFRAQSTAFGRNGAEVELKNEQFVMACLRFGRDGNSKTFRSFSDLNWVTSVFQIVCYDLLGPFCGAEVRLTWGADFGRWPPKLDVLVSTKTDHTMYVGPTVIIQCTGCWMTGLWLPMRCPLWREAIWRADTTPSWCRQCGAHRWILMRWC